MTKVLIVYGTAYGQTEKIAQRLCDRLEVAGIGTVLARGNALPPELRLGEFNGFVVAGSVLFGRHQRYLERFVRLHRGHLGRRPSAFISVCGALNRQGPEGEAEARKYRLAFLKRTGWTPRLIQSFAGAIAYTRYGRFTRWMMKAISRHNGGPVDTTRDWEFTDWDAVDRFAREFAGLVTGAFPATLVPA